MELRHIFEWTLTVLAVSLGAMLVVLVVVKSSRDRIERRREALVVEMRPVVIEAIESGAPLPLGGRRRRVAETMAVSLLSKLRGSDREALAGLLDDAGVLARARRGLDSRSPVRRLRSAQLLGAAGSVSEVEALVRLLDDRDSDVREAAAQALGRLGDPGAVGPLFEQLDADRVSGHAVSMAVMRIGADASVQIAAALGNDAARSRAVAAELVGILGVYGARRHLEHLLDEPGAVRISAARSLGRLGFPSSTQVIVDRLERVLGSDDPGDVDWTIALISALSSIGSPDAIPVLRLAAVGHYRVAVVARRALAAQGVAPIEHLPHPLDRADLGEPARHLAAHGGDFLPDLLPVLRAPMPQDGLRPAPSLPPPAPGARPRLVERDGVRS